MEILTKFGNIHVFFKLKGRCVILFRTVSVVFINAHIHTYTNTHNRCYCTRLDGECLPWTTVGVPHYVCLLACLLLLYYYVQYNTPQLLPFTQRLADYCLISLYFPVNTRYFGENPDFHGWLPWWVKRYHWTPPKSHSMVMIRFGDDDDDDDVGDVACYVILRSPLKKTCSHLEWTAFCGREFLFFWWWIELGNACRRNDVELEIIRQKRYRPFLLRTAKCEASSQIFKNWSLYTQKN